jgi:hypothetical protein
MRVDAAQAAEASGAAAHALEVRQLDLVRVADRHVLDAAVAVDERADLTAGLVRDLAERARKLLRNQAIARQTPLVQIAQTPDLVCLESVRLAVELRDGGLLRPNCPLS